MMTEDMKIRITLTEYAGLSEKAINTIIKVQADRIEKRKAALEKQQKEQEEMQKRQANKNKNAQRIEAQNARFNRRR